MNIFNYLTKILKLLENIVLNVINMSMFKKILKFLSIQKF